MMKQRRKLAVSFMIGGTLLIAAAATLFLYNRWDENRASDAAIHTAQELTTIIRQHMQAEPLPDTVPDYTDEPFFEDSETDTVEPERLPTIEYDGKNYIGVMNIQALDLSLPVVETWSYPKLKVSPCIYSGDPRENTMVVMAHNYTKHFGNIALLHYGDIVTFIDATGFEYVYEVAEIETVNSNDIIGMIENNYDFTMFTCTYSGQARVAVRCIRIDTE